MTPRWHTASVAGAFSIAGTSGAALVVFLLYVPALATPFTGPKESIFQLAAALGFGALLLLKSATGDSPRPVVPAGADHHPPEPQPLTAWGRPLTVGMLLVLASGTLSAVIAAQTPPGAPYALSSLLRWVALCGIACGVAASGGSSSARTGLFQAVTAAAAMVSVIGLFQHIDLFRLPIPVISTPGSTFGNRNLAGEAIALSLPFGVGALCLAGGRWERRIVVCEIALQIVYLAATRARGAWLGGALGILTVVLVGRRPWSRAAVVSWVGLGVVTLLVALLPGRANPQYAADTKRLAQGFDVVETSFDPDSTALRTRIGLWRRSLAMFRSRPLTGVGPGNWAVFFPRFAEPGATADGVLSATLAPRHAHCDLLEWLAETGAVGLGSFLALAVGVTITIRRRLASPDAGRRVSTSVAAGTLVALVGASATGFPLEMPATLTLAGLALGLISSNDAGQGAGPAVRWRFPDWAAEALTVAILGIAAIGAEERLRGSYWLGKAERTLHDDRGPLGAARALFALERAEKATPGTFRVALRTAHAEFRLRHTIEAVRACDAANAREPFSPNAWATLAAVQLDAGDAESAHKSVAWSLELLHDYPYALFVNAQATDALGDHAAAAAAWAHLETLVTAPGVDKETALSARELLSSRDARQPRVDQRAGRP